MKKLFTIVLLFPVFVLAQTFKPDLDIKSSFNDNKPAYMLDTVSVSNLTKAQLYSNAINYVSKHFEDYKAVLEYKDADLGEVSFKGFVPTFYEGNSSFLEFKCKIYTKDNKYKIALYSLKTPMIAFDPSVMATIRIEDYKPYNKAAKDSAVALIKAISDFMNRKPDNDF